MSTRNSHSKTRGGVITLQKFIWWLSDWWLAVALLLAAMVLGLALLAPALLAEGYPAAAQRVYGWLAPHDHQLPQRSYFLFGENGFIQTYSREQVLVWGAAPGQMRAFVGNAEIGYKMGLNHRMTAIFVGILVGGVGWAVAGGRPRVGAVFFLLCLLPLLLDGFSHMSSERSGQGFRESNQWAVALTGGAFSPEFYTGTTSGTLNWLLRTVTGLLFGVGLVWFLFTYFDYRFARIRAQLKPKLAKETSENNANKLEI